MTDYEKQANDFCERTGTTIKTRFYRQGKYFPEDTVPRDVYGVILERKNFGRVSFTFGQSIAHSDYGETRPTNYDILACIEKYEVAIDVWDFAKEFGCEINSKKSFRKVTDIHEACLKQYADVMRVFSDVIDDLRGIN